MTIKKILGAGLPIAFTFPLLASVAIADTLSLPSAQNQPFDIYDGLAVVQGDIIYGYASEVMSKKQDLTARGLGRDSKLDKWVNGIVYYTLDPEFETAELDKVLAAIDHWNTNTSISMVERTAGNADKIPDYITFEPYTGCASWVGRIGGPQDLWVGTSCTVGSVIHEIGHAIGLFHEHTRSDRNDYITIVTENITDGKEFNFDIIDDGVSPIGVYDYGSIMHYGEAYFSISGAPTISAPDGIYIGQRLALSDMDKASIDIMYGTDLALTNNISTNDDDSRTIDVTVTNNATSGAHGITYLLPLAGGATVVSADGTGWVCDTEAPTLTCIYPAVPESGSSALSIVLNNAEDNIIEDASLNSKTFDTDLSNNGKVVSEISPPDTETVPVVSDPEPIILEATNPVVTDPVPPEVPATPAVPETPDMPVANTPEIDTTDAENTTELLAGAAKAADAGAGALTWLLGGLLLIAGIRRQHNRAG